MRLWNGARDITNDDTHENDGWPSHQTGVLQRTTKIRGNFEEKEGIMERKDAKREAFEKAIDSLARYKFMMFGYYAAIWVYMNQTGGRKEGNPFAELVALARQMRDSKTTRR